MNKLLWKKTALFLVLLGGLGILFSGCTAREVGDSVYQSLKNVWMITVQPSIVPLLSKRR